MGAPMLVGFDVTVAARAPTGMRVYARELEAALAGRSCTIRAWQRNLGAPGRGVGRVLSAARLMSWFLLDVPRRVRREGVDVYHSLASLGPLRPGCPSVMSVHDATLLTNRSHFGWIDRLYHRVFSVLAARRADAVVVPSAASRREVARTYGVPDARIHVVHGGVSSRFHPSPAAERASLMARLGLRAPYVLVIGARVPRKNIEALLVALARVRDAGHPELQLAIAGPEDPGDGRLRARIGRLGLAPAVRWLGWIRDDDQPALYGGALCLAYPSLEEGFGIPILEAMASGAAVLTSDRSSMAELAGDAAHLVDPTSPIAIASGLQRLVEDAGLRADLVARGTARAAGFAWENAAAATEGVYRLVARRTG
jgi:glycosyltransferase involved in cell wall biosynthesis